MTRTSQIALIGMLVLVTLGCAERSRPKYLSRQDLVDLVIDPSCLTEPLLLRQCNPKVEPPKCRHLGKITYRKGCERILVGGKQP